MADRHSSSEQDLAREANSRPRSRDLGALRALTPFLRPYRARIAFALAALVAAAGSDAWLLFRMGVMRLESPLYARIFLAGIHDPGFLHVRVVFEAVGALAGAVAGWIIAERRSARARPDG